MAQVFQDDLCNWHVAACYANLCDDCHCRCEVHFGRLIKVLSIKVLSHNLIIIIMITIIIIITISNITILLLGLPNAKIQ